MNRAEAAKTLAAARDALEQRHLAGAGGMETCHSWSATADGIIAALVEQVAGDTRDLPFALAALGGYGRKELNPYSDIDLLFLYEKDINHTEGTLPGKIIPALWDMGFKVGHSTRTIADCLKIAQHDLVSKTSMLEARFLLGNLETFNLFEIRFRKTVATRQVERFLREKWVETELRHEKFHNSCYLTEPDVKESPGGLRDYHVALWVAAARYDVRDGLQGIHDRGLADAEEIRQAERAVDLLLRLRNDIHFFTKSTHNQLDYGIQPRIAQRLGYEGEGDAQVIRMMGAYYRNADIVYRLCQSLQEQAKRYRTKTQMFLLKLRYRELAPRIFAGEDEIFLKETTSADLAQDPHTIFKVLCLMAEKGLRPSPGLRKMLSEVGLAWKKEKPAYGELGRGLRQLLETPEPVQALQLMRDCKLMTAVIPEFHAIRYLTPFDLYHKFTVADHSFRAIYEFDNLKRSERPECDLLRGIYQSEQRKDLVRLALLLHDIGKGTGHHQDETIEPEIVLRLGYSAEEAATVERLVRLHLLMNSVAQRRDIHDTRTVLEFCETVGDANTLRRLYMLTYADTSAVGPQIWNNWKGALLKELFTLGDTYFSGIDPMRWVAPGRFVPQEQVTPELARFIKGMPDKYFFLRSPEDVVKDGEAFNQFLLSKPAALLKYRFTSDSDPGDLTVVSTNRIGLLYHIVGVLSSKNIDILQSQILTHDEEIAFDIFRVSGPNGKPINDAPFWARVETETVRVLSGETDVDELVRSRTKAIIIHQHVPQVDPLVRVLNDVSPDHTVIETVCRDRIGLLYDITRALSLMGLDIVSARIATEGQKAVNIFYVSEPGVKRVINPERLEEIKAGVRKALSPVTAL